MKSVLFLILLAFSLSAFSYECEISKVDTENWGLQYKIDFNNFVSAFKSDKQKMIIAAGTGILLKSYTDWGVRSGYTVSNKQECVEFTKNCLQNFVLIQESALVECQTVFKNSLHEKLCKQGVLFTSHKLSGQLGKVLNHLQSSSN